jgi:ribonucleoside-diphosphate reductase beta chain
MSTVQSADQVAQAIAAKATTKLVSDLSVFKQSIIIQKRDGSKAEFDEQRIRTAVTKAFKSVHGVAATATPTPELQNNIDVVVHAVLFRVLGMVANGAKVDVETIQDTVEQSLMSCNFHDVAKAYILYRNERASERKRNIFKKRINLKPYEYPELLEYNDAIRHSYWIHTEFNFTIDIQDFKARITDVERSAITNTMLAISQIEVAVKTFWGDVYKRMPKPEIGAIGATFAESEVRHHDAYSHLLEILGLNERFETLTSNPVIMERVHYLEDALSHARSENPQEYSESILLFALFIEHVSLFSQFFIIMAFNKHRDRLKGISNVVEATSKEEQIHGNFGIDLIKIIKAENPAWFGTDHSSKVQDLCRKAYASEEKIIEWIFEAGELDFLPKTVVKEFIKNRFNMSLKSIGIDPIFSTDATLLKESDWFDDEIIGTKHGDFFVKRSINYNKRSKSVTSEDLF